MILSSFWKCINAICVGRTVGGFVEPPTTCRLAGRGPLHQSPRIFDDFSAQFRIETGGGPVDDHFVVIGHLVGVLVGDLDAREHQEAVPCFEGEGALLRADAGEVELHVLVEEEGQLCRSSDG